MTMLADRVDGVIGVDTHRDTLTAAAVTAVGGLLGQVAVAADAGGYQRLLDFARVQISGRRCFAVEGAGSYGAGLTRLLCACIKVRSRPLAGSATVPSSWRPGQGHRPAAAAARRAGSLLRRR
jgi:hypothetical protein